MSVLVTAGCGFVGSWIVRELAKLGKKVIVYDLNLEQSNPLFKEISDSIVFVSGSIPDYPRLVDTFSKFGKEIEGIIHSAAVTTDPAEPSSSPVAANPHYGVMVNTVGSLNILEVARVFRVNRIVCISSGAVYGETPGILSEDKTPVNPSDLYGASKASAELVGLQYAHHYKVNFRCARLYFVYGPRAIPSEQNTLYKASLDHLKA